MTQKTLGELAVDVVFSTTWQDRVPRVHTGVSKGDMQVNIKHKEVNIC